MYNYHEAFQTTKPHICPTCAEKLAHAAFDLYHAKYPDIEGTVDIQINLDRRVVVVNAIPVEEYLWSELGVDVC